MTTNKKIIIRDPSREPYASPHTDEERSKLGVADALSVYSGWRPAPGKSDAHRDVICMITANGGTNPLEAGAFVVEHVKNVVAAQASGVGLRLKQSEER